MYISIVDAGLSWVYYAGYHVCDWNLPNLYMKTVYEQQSVQLEWRAVETLQASLNFSNYFFLFSTVLLNLMLSIDLILMIRYPFASKSKRVPVYLTSSFSVAFLMAFMGVYGTTNVLYPDNKKYKAMQYIILTVVSLYIIIAVVSMFYAFQKLKKPCISREV